MRMLLKIVLVFVLLAVALSGATIVKNGVPLVEKPGPIKRLLVYLSRNTAQTRPGHEWPELRPRTYAASAGEMVEQVECALNKLGWQVVESGGPSDDMHAVVSTTLLRFKDDVRIRLEPVSKQRTRMHVISSSRVGRADYGANLGHIVALHRALEPLEDRDGRPGQP